MINNLIILINSLNRIITIYHNCIHPFIPSIHSIHIIASILSIPSIPSIHIFNPFIQSIHSIHSIHPSIQSKCQTFALNLYSYLVRVQNKDLYMCCVCVHIICVHYLLNFSLSVLVTLCATGNYKWHTGTAKVYSCLINMKIWMFDHVFWFLSVCYHRYFCRNYWWIGVKDICTMLLYISLSISTRNVVWLFVSCNLDVGSVTAERDDFVFCVLNH